MSKVENSMQASDGKSGGFEPMQDARPGPAAIERNKDRDLSLIGQPKVQDGAGAGRRSLLSGPAAPQGRKSLFRR